MFRFLRMDSKNLLLKNHILLLFKIFVDISRPTGTVEINALLVKLSKMKHIEKNVSGNNNNKLKNYKKIALCRKCFAKIQNQVSQVKTLLQRSESEKKNLSCSSLFDLFYFLVFYIEFYLYLNLVCYFLICCFCDYFKGSFSALAVIRYGSYLAAFD